MKVCFVGIGSIAKRHINNLIDICEERHIELQIDAFRHSEGGTLSQIENIYTDISKLPTDYDIIFITNPTELHVQTLARLHNHGRHFFIEKPVATLHTLDELKKIELRDDSVYYVAGPLRYNRVIEYIRDNIDPANVTSVRAISSSYLPDWRPGIDYRDTYSAHKNLGGGVSIDLIHEWDYITDIFGMPEDVHMMCGKVSDLEIDSEDYAIYLTRYSDKIVELHLDYFGRKPIRNIELIMKDETIVGDSIAGTVTYLKSGEVIELQEERDSFQKKELAFFMDKVSEGRYNNIEHAMKVLKLTQGILED